MESRGHFRGRTLVVGLHLEKTLVHTHSLPQEAMLCRHLIRNESAPAPQLDTFPWWPSLLPLLSPSPPGLPGKYLDEVKLIFKTIFVHPINNLVGSN